MKSVREAIDFLRGMPQDAPLKVVLMCEGDDTMLEANVAKVGQNEATGSVGFVVVLPKGSFQLQERADAPEESLS